jgi:hypothetical protein
VMDNHGRRLNADCCVCLHFLVSPLGLEPRTT